MNDYQKIAQWILSDIHYNAPIYTDLCKKVIPLYGSILPENINYRIEREDLTRGGRKFDLDLLPNEYLHIFLTDICYRPGYPHNMETLITVIKTDKIQPSTSNHHVIPNTHHFNQHNISSPYRDTIFNYLYVMKHVREHKLNLLLSDGEHQSIKKNSPEYLSHSDLKSRTEYSDTINPST